MKTGSRLFEVTVQPTHNLGQIDIFSGLVFGYFINSAQFFFFYFIYSLVYSSL